ncbi:MAG: hypothetical protein IT207_01625 [Fimbriimonadaceae bacterium]|nr:hypothetical protein [Fimbriimonadaceae bacterium]
MRKLPRWAKFAVLVIGLGLGAGAAWWLYQVGSAALDLAKAGAFSEVEQREYHPDREGNLKAIHKALMLVAESDGALPTADWESAAMLRLKTRDLSEEEAKKKLVPVGSDAKRYRLNEAVLGKYPKDLDPATVLVFESASEKADTGIPEPGAMAITVAGKIVEVPAE